ncbi:Arc family DNA-binding protein [Thiothrix unzii]|jgi:hypothetical protein|uniref:Arc family DNA-binding protein n=1 Tax=Thiothrix unzii TaxID=111769 RepID=UPI002A3590DD|nr:Arc family DNA-binding protein [Thiothrix unzii]MDX9987784.1 Arc family DNA-binding protein [Thiothrix unzii]
MSKVTEQPQMKIRLSSELKALIDAAADANNRSLNAEITTRLEATFQSDKADYEGGVLGTLKAIAAEEPPKTLRGTWRNFKEKMALGLRHAETLNIWKDAIKIVGYTPPAAVSEGIKAMIFAEKIEPQHVIMLLQAMKEAEIQQKDGDPMGDAVPAI